MTKDLNDKRPKDIKLNSKAKDLIRTKNLHYLRKFKTAKIYFDRD